MACGASLTPIVAPLICVFVVVPAHFPRTGFLLCACGSVLPAASIPTLRPSPPPARSGAAHAPVPILPPPAPAPAPFTPLPPCAAGSVLDPRQICARFRLHPRWIRDAGPLESGRGHAGSAPDSRGRGAGRTPSARWNRLVGYEMRSSAHRLGKALSRRPTRQSEGGGTDSGCGTTAVPQVWRNGVKS